MQEVFEKIIEKLEKELKLADREKERCARENPLQFDSAKGYAHGVGKAIEIVKQEAEKYNNGWIPCSEHQPEEAGTYNVTAYDGRILRSTHAKWQPRLKSWNLTGTMAYWKIIAWMELPSAYRPKEK